MRKALLIIGVLFCLHGFAQKTETKATFRLDLMVPQPVANKALKLSFTGIFDFGGSLSYGFNGFNIGAFYRYKQYQVRANKIPDVGTLLHFHNTGLKLSYDKPLNKYFMISPGLNVGYNFINYTELACSTSVATGVKDQAINFEPFFAAYFMIDEGWGVGLQVAYNVTTYEFDPYAVCLGEHKSYSDNERTGLMHNYSLGFSVWYDLARKGDSFDE
jgi:hypothetical protein